MSRNRVFMGSTMLTGVSQHALLDRIQKNAARNKSGAKSTTAEPKRVHRTTARERQHRDRGSALTTRVVERTAAGEIPD